MEPGMGPGGGGPGTGAATAATALDEWFADTDNYSGIVDATGRSTVVVTVGAPGNGGDMAFDPPAIRVSPGTTVVWRWSGRGGDHDVVAADGRFRSQSTADPGAELRYRFDGPWMVRYYCRPHYSAGMRGVVVDETFPDV